jgi:S-adenosylmethionine hydrolase
MPLVTLTSDLGHRDPFVATVKGRLLRRCPGVVLVDVTHEAELYDMASAALALRQALPHFPDDTLHWVGVESALPKRPRDLVAVYGKQIVIGPDDGFFSLLSDAHPDFLFALRPGVGAEHGEEGLFADSVLAAGWLAAGEDLTAIAEPAHGIAARTALRAAEAPDLLRALVVHVDRFGNAMLNVHRDQLEAMAAGRPVYVKLRRNDGIDRIRERFSEVSEGIRLVRYNHAGYLEVAINQGNAAQLLGLKLQDTLLIEFGR